MNRRFTGWHMAAILVAMFGVIVAVNLVMARAAIATFGGVVVENSYVASQRYNGWLEAARRQRRLGWTPAFALDGRRRILVTLSRSGAPIDGAALSAVATHPLGRLPAQQLGFDTFGPGRYRSHQPLPAGRWLIRLTAIRDTRRAVFDDAIAK